MSERVPPLLPDAQPAIFSGRLHPLTLLFRIWGLLRGLLIPIVIFLVLGRERFMGIFLVVFMTGPIVASVLRYFTFTYRIEGGELVLKHGLLGRTERHIPLDRVQDVRLEQGVLHRMFNVVDLQVDTAGGEGPDAVLSVLAKSEAERLRATVFSELAEVRGAQASPVQEERQVLRRVSVRELILAGMTSNKLASLVALLVLAERLGGDFLQDGTYQRVLAAWTQSVAHWFESQSAAVWLLVGAALLGLTVVGMVLSVIGSVVMFYGFTLARVGEDLHRSYGLLTRRSSSLPRHRIQLLKIEERLVRRLFHLATLRADTAAGAEQGQARGGRDVLLPVLPRSEVEDLLPSFFSDWPSNSAEWRQVSRRAIYRATAKGTLVCLVLTGFLCWPQPKWTDFWPLLLIPLVLWLSVMSYRHLGYGLGRHYFQTRRGWLSRATHIIPIRNTQVVVVEQTPFDRRHRVATLSVDTAGQAYTGGGPRISNVPVKEAMELARKLAHEAAAMQFRV